MGDSQPPGAPPGEWKRRSDGSTELALIRVELEQIDARLKGHVTWQGLWGSAIALLALVATLVFTLQGPVKDATASTRQEMREQRKDVGQELKDMRQELRQMAKEVRAVRSVAVDGKPRQSAQQELRREEEKE